MDDNIFDLIIAFEQGELDDEEVIELFQRLAGPGGRVDRCVEVIAHFSITPNFPGAMWPLCSAQ